MSFSYTSMFSYFLPFQFEIKHCAILLPWNLFLSNESRSFCTRLFLFRFINRNRNTAQKEYALSVNNPRFDKAIEKIYPSELTLKDTTLADGKVAYLDRQIEIRDR